MMKKKYILALIFALLLVNIPITNSQDDTVEKTFVHDGTWGYYLPDGWVASEGTIQEFYIASDEATLESMQNDNFPVVTEGNYGIGYFVFLRSDIEEAIASETNSFQYNLLDFFYNDLLNSENDVTLLSPPEEFFIGERAVAIFTVVGEDFEGYVMATQMAPDYYGVSIVAFALGEREDLQQAAFDVFDGIYFSQPLDATHEGETFTFDYPETWTVQVQDAGIELPVVTNNSELLERIDEPQWNLNDHAITMLDLTEEFEGELEDIAISVGCDIFSDGENCERATAIDFNGETLYSVRYNNNEEPYTPEGGALVMEKANGRIYGLFYRSNYEQTDLIFLTAADMLQSIETVE